MVCRDGIAEETEASALRPLQQGSIVYRIAFGSRAGRKVLTLREAMPLVTDSEYEPKPLCANEQGFSLHAAVRCLANDRIKINPNGQVELKLKTPWRALAPRIMYCRHWSLCKGWQHWCQGLDPLQGALGQRPDSSSGTNSPQDCLCLTRHLIRFHGVLAPNAK